MKMKRLANFKSPLLAKVYPDSLNPEGYWISEKLDGVRAYWTGQRLVTRTGGLLEPPAEWLQGFPEGQPLDGELTAGRERFQDTVSIVRCVSKDKGWHEVKFRVFDAPSDKPFEERLKDIPETGNIIPLEHWVCKGREHVDECLEVVLGKGGEGLMLRQPGSKYEYKRSSTLLKVKRFFDAEAKVLAHLPGKGKHVNRMGALKVEWNDKTFKVGSGFTDEEREHPPDIGDTITFKYQELTRAGKPRFPVFLRTRNFKE
jgi:DNA ligase-1